MTELSRLINKTGRQVYIESKLLWDFEELCEIV